MVDWIKEKNIACSEIFQSDCYKSEGPSIIVPGEIGEYKMKPTLFGKNFETFKRNYERYGKHLWKKRE